MGPAEFNNFHNKSCLAHCPINMMAPTPCLNQQIYKILQRLEHMYNVQPLLHMKYGILENNVMMLAIIITEDIFKQGVDSCFRTNVSTVERLSEVRSSETSVNQKRFRW